MLHTNGRMVAFQFHQERSQYAMFQMLSTTCLEQKQNLGDEVLYFAKRFDDATLNSYLKIPKYQILRKMNSR